ncbi:MAG: NAD-dependent epimerase/dehydratase family protein [Ilumatobacteraceae bacterium]
MAHTEHTVMVVGASGLVGTAAVERFLADGAEVIAVSRRAPEVTPSPRLRHLPLDLRDADACRAAAPSFAEVTHVVYAAVYEMPGLVPGWTDPHQMSVNLQMLTNVLDAVAASPVRHLSLLQGTKAYGAHLHPIRVPARESEPRDAHENFYWLHEDLVRERSAREGWSFTIWRLQLIVGPNHGVVMNIPPVIGVRRHQASRGSAVLLPRRCAVGVGGRRHQAHRRRHVLGGERTGRGQRDLQHHQR